MNNEPKPQDLDLSSAHKIVESWPQWKQDLAHRVLRPSHPKPERNPMTTPTPPYDEKKFAEKQDRAHDRWGEEIQALFKLVNDLTLGRERMQAEIVGLTNCVSCQQDLIEELRSKLKETISAVTKLAKGKSLGALGLPTEESWTRS